tara:strand:+ start:10661 stop:11401 length:741 start_codon:yes stop_codon:yes gene_type:complete
MNAADSLSQCLSSITSQTYKNVEILIADGGSVDGTRDIVASFKDHVYWYESSPDRGIYDAWNKAIAHCGGEWICFLGADDAFTVPESLESVVPSLCSAQKSAIPLVYSRINEVSASGQVVSRLGLPPEEVAWQLKHGMPRHIPHTGMFHNRKLFAENGLYSTHFRIAGDYEFLLRCVGVDRGAFLFHEGVLVNKGIGGVSFRHQVETIREFYKARVMNGMRGFTFPWLFVYSRAIIRAWCRRLIRS